MLRVGADYQRYLTDAMRLKTFSVPEIPSENAPHTAWWRVQVEDVVYAPERRLAVIVIPNGQYRLPVQLLGWAEAVHTDLADRWHVAAPFPFVAHFGQVDGEFLVDMKPILG
ncbi:hypothetical protein [Kitasatospora sp. NPDC085464]|uniref:hypothetical protein n=1 Tax=Kitasatospora sp. NPDC085464 TaxID=3364063 RepID=UPI0037C9A8D6